MEHIPVDTVNSLLNLKKDGNEVTVHLEPLSLVFIARERIVTKAIFEKYDYLLFVDSDMVFKPDLLRQLLKTGKDVVSGLAFMRKPPYNPCIHTKMRLGNAGEREEELLNDFDAGLIKVEGIGLACCLIKVSVLKTLREQNTSLFWPIFGYGEDLSFCIKLRKAGIDVWADTRIRVGHLGQTDVTQAEYDAWNEK